MLVDCCLAPSRSREPSLEPHRRTPRLQRRSPGQPLEIKDPEAEPVRHRHRRVSFRDQADLRRHTRYLLSSRVSPKRRRALSVCARAVRPSRITSSRRPSRLIGARSHPPSRRPCSSSSSRRSSVVRYFICTNSRIIYSKSSFEIIANSRIIYSKSFFEIIELID